jgi:ankyrin repeat protein
MYAVGNNSDPEVITALIGAGADVNAKNIDGITVLMCAALGNSNPEVIAALLQIGADINARTKNGKRAIDFAAQNTNLTGTEIYRRLQGKASR